MKCRDLLRILPELVENELDEKTTALALAHVNKCHSCRGEKAKYEEVLRAAAEPWETVEEPDDLVLVIPERSRPLVTLPRVAWVTAAAVVCIGFLSMLHPRPLVDHKMPVKVVEKHQKQSPLVVVPREETKPETAVRTAEHVVAPGITGVNKVEAVINNFSKPKMTAVARHYQHNRRFVKKTSVVASAKPLQEVRERPKSEIALTGSANHEEPSAMPAKPVVVIALEIPQPSVIETESVDETTGKVSITTVTLNEVGEEITSEITYLPYNTDDWRHKL